MCWNYSHISQGLIIQSGTYPHDSLVEPGVLHSIGGEDGFLVARDVIGMFCDEKYTILKNEIQNVSSVYPELVQYLDLQVIFRLPSNLNIRHTKSQNLNVSHLVLSLSN